ncbi:MAG TPA: acyltransferase family protein [Ilumatobacteraceae bacterium]|nr:acyltransferase family protein [Ilumatobacteraceae bacterium]
MSPTVLGQSSDTTRIDAIDGLRAISVIAVIAFHTDRWLPGGYLGVSVFFTISGFVIGRNLFSEHQRSKTIRLGNFYARRLRRLIPASLLCVLLVILTQPIFSAYDPNATRDELPWVLLPVYNWYQRYQQHSYADIFRGAQSPFVHYWSLAIEEQVYLILPIAVLAMLALVKGSASRQRILFAVAGASAVVPLAIHANSGPQAVYYATHSRAGEVLIGVALAWWVLHRPVPSRLSWPALVALIAIVAAMVATGSDETAWPYRGGLPLVAIATAIVLGGCLIPTAPLARVLAVGPLAYLGRISYGVYLFHWPLSLIVGDQLPDASRPIRFLCTTLVAVALAAVSFAVLEMPIQRIRRPGAWSTLAASLAAAGVMLTAGLVVLQPERRPTTDVRAFDPNRVAAVNLSRAASASASDADPTTTTSPVAAPAATAVDPPDSSPATIPAETTAADTKASDTKVADLPASPSPLRVLLTGDSTAVSLGEGVIDYLYANPAEGSVAVVASGACGLLAGGELRDRVVNTGLQMYCPRSRQAALTTMADAHPDAVVVMITLADSWPRSWDGRRTWLRPTDHEFLDRLRGDYESFASYALARAGCVVWVRPATSWVRRNGRFQVEPPHADGSQEQVDALVADLVSQHPGRMAVIDLNEWFDGRGDPGHDGRPDGLHVDRTAAGAIASDWLWPTLRAAGVGTASCQSP